MVEIVLILSDIRSTHNVGSILRSADCFGVKEIWYAGYTPYPKLANDQRLPHISNKITKAIHKTALGAEELLTAKNFQQTREAIVYAKSCGFLVVSLEQSKNSTMLQNFSTPLKIALVIGNEVEGLSQKVLKQSDVILEIPLFGKKESLNVATATAIALYNLRVYG
jgi:23S rRNA (guanosine2251-2'-O)-methyltransferase